MVKYIVPSLYPKPEMEKRKKNQCKERLSRQCKGTQYFHRFAKMQQARKAVSPIQSDQTSELLAGKLPSRDNRMLLNFQASRSVMEVEGVLQKDNGRSRDWESRDGGAGKFWKWKIIFQA